MKVKNLWVTVPYKRNRSNTENVKCRPVMSLLQLPLTKETKSILSSNHREWRMPCHTSFLHSIHHPAPPALPCLAPIYFRCIFHYTLAFWPGTLCSDFKDMSHQKWKSSFIRTLSSTSDFWALHELGTSGLAYAADIISTWQFFIFTLTHGFLKRICTYIFIYMYKKVTDTGHNFEPILMKFTWLVRVHSWVNPVLFLETIGPVKSHIWGKMYP